MLGISFFIPSAPFPPKARGRRGFGPAGQIRFHETGPGVWEIGISIHPDFRNARLAHVSLTMAMRQLAAERKVTRWTAEINPANLPSQGLFTKLGFIRADVPGDLQTWHLDPTTN